MSRRKIGFVAAVMALVLVPGTAVVAASVKPDPPKPGTTASVLPEGSDNPQIANGVAIGKDTPTYKSSGLGPSGLNSAAPAGTPERYIDTAVFPGGVLPEGVTVTEAQAINVMRRIGENLQAQGLDYDDVYAMRVFVASPDGSVADFNGFNRGYRQYFANTSVSTGKPIDVRLGTAPAAPPIVATSARPSRFMVQVANLPVTGWLVEVEVDAAYPKEVKRKPRFKRHGHWWGRWW